MTESNGIQLVIALIGYVLLLPLLFKAVHAGRSKLLIGVLFLVLCVGSAAGYQLYNENQLLKSSTGSDYKVMVGETQSMLEESSIRQPYSALTGGRYIEELTRNMNKLQESDLDHSYWDGWEELEDNLLQSFQTENEAEAKQYKNEAVEHAAVIRERLSALEEEVGGESVRWYDAFHE